MNQVTETDQMLSLMTLEERIQFRKRQFGQIVQARRAAEAQALQDEWEKAQEARLAKVQAQKARQAGNRATRAAANQNLKALRNKGGK